MATVRYGDVVQADETLTLEEKIKRRRASSGELQPQDPKGSPEQTETQNNEPKKRSV
jgi:hypothetical protein